MFPSLRPKFCCKPVSGAWSHNPVSQCQFKCIQIHFTLKLVGQSSFITSDLSLLQHLTAVLLLRGSLVCWPLLVYWVSGWLQTRFLLFSFFVPDVIVPTGTVCWTHWSWLEAWGFLFMSVCWKTSVLPWISAGPARSYTVIISPTCVLQLNFGS